MRTPSEMPRHPGWPVATAIGAFATIIVFVRLGGPAGTLASLGEVTLIALALASRRRIDRTRALAIGLIVLCVLALGAPVLRSLSTQHESRTTPTAVAHRHSTPTA